MLRIPKRINELAEIYRPYFEDGEMLPDDFDESCLAISKADLLIVAGTSLTVEPAASLVKLCNGNLVILNDTKTPYDFLATLVINEDLADIFKKL